MLEAGARFEDGDFSSGTADIKKYLWAPALGMYGIQRIDAVRDTMIVAGAGVGGGSLVYANTLYEPLPAFYNDPQWAHITDWKDELAPYYDQAKRMLGVVENPVRTPADDVMEKVAGEMGVAETFHPTPVGVFFGGPGQAAGEQVADPFFGGAGPARNTCLNCGECMSGCRHNAKNTLVKNYLYLAEQNGATVLPLTTVTRITPRDGRAAYDVRVKFTKAKTGRGQKVLTAEHVVMAAASLGTQKLLHRMKDEGHLPRLSGRLGYLSRTNSESILGAIAAKDDPTDYTYGVAITSSFHPDADTHVEPVRYGKGFNAMAMLQTVLTDGDDTGGKTRVKAWLKEMWTERKNVVNLYDFKHWSERTVIALVMQSLDNSITTYGKKSLGVWRMTSKQGHGAPEPDLDPGRQRDRTPDRRARGRHRRRQHRRAVRHAADRPLHRRLRDRRLGRDRRHRPLPARLRPPRPARRRRRRGHRQPRREPVADHHRPGRAGDVVLAQQGRGRPPSGPRRAVRAPAAGRPERPRSCPTRRPAPCGSRSSASADLHHRTGVVAGQTPGWVSVVQTDPFAPGNCPSTGVTRPHRVR